MLLRQFLLLSSVLFFFTGCKSAAESPEQTKRETKQEETPVIERGENAEWKNFESAVGKKPAEVGLLSASLKTRLKNLLKEEYAVFEKDWNEESVIDVTDRIIFTSGCQAGDCPANKYILILDVADNNINVINFKYGQVRSWEERAVIGLPDKLLEKYESIRKEQGL